MHRNLSLFLNEDQIKFMQAENANGMPWSEETIRKCLRIRCVVGARGYEFLRLTEKFLLPTYRTLYRRIEHTKLEPGISSEMIGWLEEKISQDNTPNARLCVISFDEMKIHPCVEYDRGLNRYIGYVSEAFAHDKDLETKQLAENALAVIVRGLTSHWKQLVAYGLTPRGLSAERLWAFLLDIIKQLHTANFHVVCISSDMASTNQAMWNARGIHSIRSQCTPFFRNPVSENAELCATPDAAHVLKNMWNQFQRSIFRIPEETAKMHNLPGTEIRLEHIQMLFLEEQSGGIKMAYKLKAAHFEPAIFEKMNVRLACEFFSKEVGKAVILLARTEGSSMPREAETTGWFLLQVNKWWRIMSARNKSEGLGSDEVSLERIKALKSFIDLMRSLKFERRDKTKHNTRSEGWKPIQTGSILATEVVLKIHAMYVMSGKLEYLLPSRLGTTGCENLFSQARQGDIHPKPVRLRHALRLISVAMYLRVPNSAAYEDDDEAYYVDFLKSKSPAIKEIELDTIDFDETLLTKVQEYGLYYVSGWVARSIDTSCNECKASIVCSDTSTVSVSSEWMQAIDEGGLTYPTPALYSALHIAEQAFLHQKNNILHLNDVNEVMVRTVLNKLPSHVSASFCKAHNILQSAIRKFVSLRIHVVATHACVKELVGGSVPKANIANISAKAKCEHQRRMQESNDRRQRRQCDNRFIA